jgi:hypothetical protein
MKRNILVFGLISGALASAFMATSMAWAGCAGSTGNMATGMIIGYTGMAAAFTFIFVGIKNYRDKQNAGVISFGKAFLLGLLISFIASTMYVATWGVQYHYFMPDFMDKYSAIQIQQINASGKPADQIQAAIADVNQASYNYKHNILFFAMYTYMEILPVGILITLISSMVLKRKTAKFSSAD